MYANGTTRRKARAKMIGENTKTRNRGKNKQVSVDLNPEDGLFKALRAEILKNVTED